MRFADDPPGTANLPAGQFHKCIGLWLLKKTHLSQIRRNCIASECPLSRIVWTFSIPQIVPICWYVEFFNTHACYHQLTPGLRFAFDSGTIQEMIRVDLHQGKSQDLIGETDEGQG